MSDERMKSTREGIAAPPESAEGKRADDERRQKLSEQTPQQRPDSAMGGTSDADSPGDEAFVEASQGLDEDDDARAERARNED